MGIGLEGGLAPYIDRGEYPLPEVRLWAMMKTGHRGVRLPARGWTSPSRSTRP